MTETQRMRQKRHRLYSQNPICPMCGRKMVLVEKIGEGGSIPDNAATIDHIDSRLSNRRGKNRPNRIRLLCLRCNNLRGAYEESRLPIKELWARSGDYPKGLQEKIRTLIRHRRRRRYLERKVHNLAGYAALMLEENM